MVRSRPISLRRGPVARAGIEPTTNTLVNRPRTPHAAHELGAEEPLVLDVLGLKSGPARAGAASVGAQRAAEEGEQAVPVEP